MIGWELHATFKFIVTAMVHHTFKQSISLIFRMYGQFGDDLEVPWSIS